MAIYWKLREVLDAKGMTPLELARALGVKHPSMYRLAKQRHVSRMTLHAGMLDDLCRVLDCEPGDLLSRKRPRR